MSSKKVTFASSSDEEIEEVDETTLPEDDVTDEDEPSENDNETCSRKNERLAHFQSIHKIHLKVSAAKQFIDNILEELCPGTTIEVSAIQALRTHMQKYAIDLIRAGGIATHHAGREKVGDKEMDVVINILDMLSPYQNSIDA
jgi:histone H3/H4